MNRVSSILSGLLIVASLCSPSFADDAGIEFFEKQIRPVLVDYCYKCHSSESDEAAGGLLLDTRDGIRAGGETGPAIVPQDLDESLLLSAIEYRDLEMPPDEMLGDDVVEYFKKWIEMGAPDPRSDSMPEKHTKDESSIAKPPLWSLQPVANPAVPEVNNESWPCSNVDRFVLARLEQAKLTPAADASPHTLLRRVSFDLTGLPPASDEVEAFLTDPSPESFEAFVDRSLASPQFGERWARHWLDVVRYGESAGSSRDVLMLYSWRYRDYVIDAFNADLPYDEFVRQQIAGDLMDAADEATRQRQIIATGLLAIGSKSLNGGNLDLDIADDQIDVISKSVMGLTVSCARCHDHKFDPIPTADYYALAGIFRNTHTFYGGSTNRPKNLKDQLKVYLPLSDDFTDSAGQLQKLATQIAAAQKKVTQLENRRKSIERQLPDGWKTIVDENAEVKISQQTIRRLQQHKTTIKQLKTAKGELDKLKAEQDKLPAPQFAHAVRDANKPKDWPIQERGEKGKAGSIVPRGFLSCVALPETIEVASNQSGRLQLADWLTHRDHPLTSRVIVNRVWQHLFGRGLVESVNNFGTSGSVPSHPQLLDHLAHRFVHHHDWSIKSLIRELILTRTYQMSSELNDVGWQHDPANQLLWRANRRRLEAEAIRDAMLFASGQLNLNRPNGSLVQEIGEGEVGRNINTKPLERPFLHRSVYLPIIRGLLPEMLKVFDFPEPSNPAGQRSETNVPTQSLFLLNSDFAQQQSVELAKQVQQAASDDRQRIKYAWLICLSRLPEDEEVDRAIEFVNQFSASSKSESIPDSDPWQVLCQSILASAEFRFLD